MKKIMMETAQHICGMSEGPCRHKETWCWNEEVAEAVREKKISTENGREKIRRRHGWSIRSVGRMQRGLYPHITLFAFCLHFLYCIHASFEFSLFQEKERKRNRRNAQVS